MEPWVHLVNLVVLVKLDLLDFLEHQVLKETWEHLEKRVVLACKVLGENLESLVCLESLVKWVLLVRMVTMERKEVLVCQVLQGHQASLDLEDNLV